MPEKPWYLFVSQLPASPSSPRVMAWRRMRAAGAISLQNGVWALPVAPAHTSFMQELLDYVHDHGGSGQVFTVTALNEAVQADLVARCCMDRQQEYAEFSEQVKEFLAEIEKETQGKKLIFDELEENEQNLARLENWLRKINERDFFPDTTTQTAAEELTCCRQALESFARSVYRKEGFEPPNGDRQP